MNKLSGTLIASAVCALFAASAHAKDTATPTQESKDKKAKTVTCVCHNDCAGQGCCGAHKTDNSCANHKFEAKDAEACKAAGGNPG